MTVDRGEDPGKSLLFLPGGPSGRLVGGEPRPQGWIGTVSNTEAEILICQRLAVIIPDDWALLWPMPDEPLSDYVTRAIVRHPFVASLTSLRPAFQLDAECPNRLQPSVMTYENWQRDWPERHFSVMNRPAEDVKYYCGWAVQRLLVELCNRLKGGDWVMRARETTDPEYRILPIKAWRFDNYDMFLDLRTQWFGPASRPGHPPPPEGVPSFVDLTIGAAIAASSAPVIPPDPRPKATEALWKSFFTARVDGWSDDLPAPTEEEDFQAATQHFAPGFSRDEDFRVMRRQYTPPGWQKQGRRRSWGAAKQSAANLRNREPHI